MTQNMGTADRLIRIALALGVAVLYFTGRIGGTPALLLEILAIVFVLTSVVGWCPAYLAFGLSTRQRPARPTSAA